MRKRRSPKLSRCSTIASAPNSAKRTDCSSTRSRRRPSRTSTSIKRPGQPAREFQLGIKKLIQELMLERIAENDAIVERYISDEDFQRAAFPILAREIFEAIHDVSTGAQSSSSMGPID